MVGAKKRGRPRTEKRLDDWHRVIDPRERKRIQDRLAQRARRERRARAPNSEPPQLRSVDRPGKELLQGEVLEPRSSSDPGEDLVQKDLPDVTEPIDIAPWSSNHSIARAPETTLAIVPRRSNSPPAPAVLERAARALISPSLYDYQFLPSPSWWRIYIALVKHALMIGGPVCPASDEEVSSAFSGLPQSLQPTPLQLAVPHRRWIDRFPFPRFRDNMILLSSVVDYDQFCSDLFSMASIVMLAERPTWEPSAWTIGPEFASKWGYLFY